MDYDEYEIVENSINPNNKYSEEIEFVIAELNNITNMAGRYSRSVQIPIAIRIVKKLKEINKNNKK